jgi:hypothetical protein
MAEIIPPTLSRRGALQQLAGGAALIGAGTAVLPESLSPIGSARAAMAGARSGMSWQSGASISQYAAFASYRGRQIDTITAWCPHATWTDITALKGGFSTARKSGARVCCAMRLLPLSHDARKYPGNYKLAASGTYDGYYIQYAQKLAATNLTNVICRIGWETNGDSRPDFCKVDREAFKTTWQRIAMILRQYNPTILTEWNNIKKGGQGENIMNYYPGDEYVDIFGVNYYDGWPPLENQAIWDKQYYASYKGGPWGIGAWAAEARSRGKLFASSEWGINAGRYNCKDNPFYIESMYQFFVKNNDILAYENYFNQKGYHQLNPSDLNPLSSAKYRQLWGTIPAPV